MWLQKKHNEIIMNNPNKPEILQTSLAELHKLNITLSNYYDVAPTILNLNLGSKEKNDCSIPNPQQDKEIIV